VRLHLCGRHSGQKSFALTSSGQARRFLPFLSVFLLLFLLLLEKYISRSACSLSVLLYADLRMVSALMNRRLRGKVTNCPNLMHVYFVRILPVKHRAQSAQNGHAVGSSAEFCKRLAILDG
jgi:hypothetical protein